MKPLRRIRLPGTKANLEQRMKHGKRTIRPVGSPVIITSSYYGCKPRFWNEANAAGMSPEEYQISKQAPKGANAYVEGKRYDRIQMKAGTVYQPTVEAAIPIQYYSISET